MTDAETDAAANIYSLTQLAIWLSHDWRNAEARAYLVKNFELFENDFDRIAQMVEKIREIRGDGVVVDLRRVG